MQPFFILWAKKETKNETCFIRFRSDCRQTPFQNEMFLKRGSFFEILCDFDDYKSRKVKKVRYMGAY